MEQILNFINDAVNRKYTYFTIQLDYDHNTFELDNYKPNYVVLAEQCKAIVGDAMFELVDDTCDHEMVVRYESNNNMNGDVNMNKLFTKKEIREQLEAVGVTMSNTTFKNTKYDELLNQLMKAQIEYNSEENIVSENSNSLMVQGVAIPEEVQAPQFDITSLVSMMAGSLTNGIKSAVSEVVVPAVSSVVEAGNDRVLAELKSQLDTMNKTLAGMVSNQQPVINARQPIAKCEDCGADIYNENVVKYSKANCGGHTYCYNHQEAHKVQKPNSVGGFGQPQQQPQEQPIIKSCICCGTKTRYNTVAILNQSVAKAQALGLPAIICKKCAEKILAERKLQQATQVQQPVAPVMQMPVGNIVTQVNPNNQGF